jgi:NitT/TauT family transport system substrate-binding protein
MPAGRPGVEESMRPLHAFRSEYLLTAIAAALSLLAASVLPAAAEPARQLRIGVQYGLGYLPLYVAKDAGFLADRMRKQGLDPAKVEIVPFAGGPQINDGLLSGNLEIGSGGLTAMMVVCDKTRRAGDAQLLGATALASVPYELFTTDPELKSLRDLNKDRDRIGVPSVKISVPAIYLQMAAERLYGAGQQAALDEYTVSLAQPDGIIALLSGGGVVNGYLLSPPFIQQVSSKPGIHRAWSSNELFETPATALSTWTTVKFRRDNPKLFAAFVAAMRDAIELIDADPLRAAGIYVNNEKSKLAPDFIAAVLADKTSIAFSLAPRQSQQIAEFLSRVNSIKTKPATWRDFFFPDIHAEDGS